MNRTRTLDEQLLANAAVRYDHDNRWRTEPLMRKASGMLAVPATEPKRVVPSAGKYSDHAEDGDRSEDEWCLGDAFASADWDSGDLRCPSEDGSRGDYTVESDERDMVHEDVDDDDRYDLRMSRRDWFELDRMLAPTDEAGWIAANLGGAQSELRQCTDEDAHLQGVEFSPSIVGSPSEPPHHEIKSVPGMPTILDSLEDLMQCERVGIDNTEGKLFDIALRRNLLNQGERLNHFLDRCTWRVEDMIAEAEQTLLFHPTREEVEMYHVESLPMGEDDLVADEEIEYATTTQSFLMREIDRLLDGPTVARVHARSRSSRPHTLEKKRPVSRIPKPACRRTVRTVAKSHLPIPIHGRPHPFCVSGLELNKLRSR
ncbi:MAG: hypothetical protein Q9163_002973 [Psora crenata]